MLVCQTLPVLSLVISILNIATATNTLTSSLDGRQAACPGEVVTYTCNVTQGFTLGWTTAPVLVNPSLVRFTASNPAGRMVGCNDIASIQCSNIDFQATLTSVGPPDMNGARDMTSTFRFTATTRLNGTVVECNGFTIPSTPSINHTLIVAGLPSPPRTPSSCVQQYGRDSVTLTLQWQPPQYDGGAPVNYTITVSPGVGTFTTSRTSVSVTAPYNVIHTVSIVATNCNESSGAAMMTITIFNCSDPTPPVDGSIDPYHNTTEGAEIFFRCNPMFVPSTRMTATCASNGMWTPDPADLACTFDCGPLVSPQRGALESFISTTEGSVVFYSCDPGLVPEGRMRAVCTRNGWSPSPTDLSCAANCSDPTPPTYGSIDPYQNTTEGTEIFFRCNPGFVPAGRMRAVCGADGRWNPDPATLGCTCSPTECGAPPTLAGGVTVKPYNATTVSSVIDYQCQQSGFTPSSPSSVCGEDGRWSPDPSQVVCEMIPASATVCGAPSFSCGVTVEPFNSTAVGSEIFYQCQPGFLLEGRGTVLCGEDGRWNPDPQGLCIDKSLSTVATATITAVVCSLVTFITGALCGALLTVCIIRCNKKGRSSKPAPNAQEQQQAAVVYEEVDPQSKKIELKENVAYGPGEQDQMFELKENVAYGPVK